MSKVVVKFKRLSSLAQLPVRASKGAAGFDVFAALEKSVVVEPGEVALINTGLAMEIPDGWEIQLRPRSSMGRRRITIPNSPATIDSDFRGELAVMLFNQSSEPFVVESGHRIAQMILSEVPVMEPEWATELSPTERGDGGIGSTGR